MIKNLNNKNGITLIALVVTIVVLLILAGITINLVLADGGIFSKAEQSAEEHAKAEVREKLELKLADMQAEKLVNNRDYTQGGNDYEYLETELEKEEYVIMVSDNIVTVEGGYQFIIDRSVPKVESYFGKGQQDDNITIECTEVTEAPYTFSTITVKVTSENELKSIIFNGQNILELITEDGDYTVNEEGAYVIKVVENKTYNIYVQDESEKYNNTKISVTEITEDMKIWNIDDLVEFRNKVNEGRTFEGRTVKVMADIDMSSACSQELGSWEPIGNYASNTNLLFKGIFDGNNHTISNLYINATGTSYQGLFGIIYGTEGEKAEIRNLIMDSTCKVYGKGSVGGVVGYAYYAKISYCINNGEIKGYNTYHQGGICGSARNSEIYRCVNNGNVYGYWCVGGIVGQTQIVTVKECYNTGSIGKTADQCAYGGIVGDSYKATEIVNCYNIGIVQGYKYVGGVVGCSAMGSNIRYCYDKGSVSGSSDVGSVIGRNSHNLSPNSNAYNCYYLLGKGVGSSTGGTLNVSAVTETNLTDKTNSETSLTYLLNNNNSEAEWIITSEYPILKWQLEN